MSEQTITGGCLCGGVRSEAHGTPSLTVICHCRMCQRASGAPFMGLLFMPSDAVRVIKGYPRVYHSSPTSDRHFCPACGSPLFFIRHTRSLCAITVGSLDNPHTFTPTMHVCMESAMEWLDIRDDAPRYSAKPEGMTPLMEYDPVTGIAREAVLSKSDAGAAP